MKFSEFSLQPKILEALREMGYEELTPIQEKAIPHVLAGKDLLGVAETGSGKTGACGVPLVQMVDPTLNALQALILVPTRELAQQYVAELAEIARYTDVAPFAVFGGFDMAIQRAKLRDRVHILVATPGRLIDYLWNHALPFSHIRTMVLDEADEMLKMGFIENVDFILSCLLHDHQTLLFSATMPNAVGRLARSYLKDPVRIELNKEQIAPASLAHHFKYIARQDRLKALVTYLREETISQAIIFCNSREGVGRLIQALKRMFQSVEFIHGGLEQPQRTSIYNRFRDRSIRLLVATDVAARGLDFTHVSHVINYEFPQSEEAYTHRSGRTGRMGRSGIAMTFVADRELNALQRLLRVNRIGPVWHDRVPSFAGVSRTGGREGQRFGRKAPGRRAGRRRRRSR
jgi:ATP-dependent RNA helicase DeaD